MKRTLPRARVAQLERRRPGGCEPAIDAYLARLDAKRRSALQTLRKTIRAAVPEAEECISYRLPAFRFRGTVIAGFSATAHGCSYYPFSGRTLGTLAADLEGYGQTKSALHFDVRTGLPARLVRKLLETRIAETATRRRTVASR